MKIIIAKTAGFCMGVKRAVDLSLEHASKSTGNVFTIGPLIHNKQTIEMLKDRGVHTFDESKNIMSGATVLIRAHGIPLETQNSYQSKGYKIVDGTCPKVKTVHKVIEKYRKLEFAIVITGDKGHAEVIGLQSYAGESGHLICRPEDVEKLPDFDKVCLVSQTTFNKNTFDAIAEKIKEKYRKSEIAIKKTICSATDQRQDEIRALAASVDAMIVVGGKHSANTMRLAGIASEACKGPVQHIETEAEIDWNQLADKKNIGITAGASTPNWMINRVVEYIQLLDNKIKKTPKAIVSSIFDLLSNLNFFTATGAVALYFTSCILQGISPMPQGIVLVFLYFFSMYLWNSLASTENTKHLGLSRYKFYHANKHLLFLTVAITIACMLIISLMQNNILFYLMLFAIIAGSIYHLNIVPHSLRSLIRSKSIKDIPASRDIFVAMAWGSLITFIPQITTDRIYVYLPTVICFIAIFIQSFLRSLIYDLKDIEGDRIMGRETFVTIIGEDLVKKTIMTVLPASITALLLYNVFASEKTYSGINSAAIIGQAIAFTYVIAFMIFNRNNRANRSFLFNFIVDAQFYISGLCAWLISIL
jgi:(E)-4-hydroxy-3-methyl-but-2-enyl pyrophosphate reductase